MDAIENRFVKISQDASKLSIEFKENHPSIPWKAITSIRNRIAHDYGIVDYEILYSTVIKDFPIFKNALEAI